MRIKTNTVKGIKVLLKGAPGEDIVPTGQIELSIKIDLNSTQLSKVIEMGKALEDGDSGILELKTEPNLKRGRI